MDDNVANAEIADIERLRELYQQNFLSADSLIQLTDPALYRPAIAEIRSKGGFLEDDGHDLDFERFVHKGTIKVLRSARQITSFLSILRDTSSVQEILTNDFGWADCRFYHHGNLPSESNAGRLEWSDPVAACDILNHSHQLALPSLLAVTSTHSQIKGGARALQAATYAELDDDLRLLLRIFEIQSVNGVSLPHPVGNPLSIVSVKEFGVEKIGALTTTWTRRDDLRLTVRSNLYSGRVSQAKARIDTMRQRGLLGEESR